MTALRSFRVLWAALMLFLPPVALAQDHSPAAPGATVQELLEWADQHNPGLASLQSETEAAEARVQPAGALADLALRMEYDDITRGNTANPNLLPNRAGSVKYTLLQSFPLWGKRDLRRGIAAAEANQAKGRQLDATAELHANIKAAFAQNYLAFHAIRLTDEILGLMHDLERVTQVRYANGLVPQQDAIKAQVEQTALRSELVNLHTMRHHAETRLNVLLGRRGDAPLAAPQALRPLPSPAALDLTTLEERVRQSNPQIFSQTAQVAAAENNRQLVEKNRYPDVTLGLSPTQANNSMANSWGAMVEINIPLQQESRRAQEREASSRLTAARQRQEAVAQQVLGDLHETLAAFQAAREQESLLQTRLIPQAQLTFKAALAGYETGKLDFATVLDAQRQIRKARLDQLQAQVEQQLRLADIERLLGGEL